VLGGRGVLKKIKVKAVAEVIMTVWVHEDVIGNLEIEDIESVEDIKDISEWEEIE
jgi:hypothetical protein